MTMANIRRTRAVPAKRGMRIFCRYSQRFGRILSAKHGYLRILLDGDKYPGHFHPTFKLNYLDGDGEVIKST